VVNLEVHSIEGDWSLRDDGLSDLIAPLAIPELIVRVAPSIPRGIPRGREPTLKAGLGIRAVSIITVRQAVAIVVTAIAAVFGTVAVPLDRIEDKESILNPIVFDKGIRERRLSTPPLQAMILVAICIRICTTRDLAAGAIATAHPADGVEFVRLNL